MVRERWMLFDAARQRTIPVMLYLPARGSSKQQLKPAILSHGYGGRNTKYGFVAQTLVAQGYVVASIQHELPTDAPMPTVGNVRQVRQPFWERDVQNMLFVRQALARKFPGVELNELLLVGHSKGGDSAMLFAEEHPALAARVISLDNCRMPLPRAARPRVLSLRSSDQVADPGVLPTPAEQAEFGTMLVQLKNTVHNDMWDGATKAEKQEMSAAISRFLTK
ncbi:alpha/beta fold hydrolase [Hymenobacter glaciei]|uniref:Alpha/beta fold hydrolase n=2 Tax=Hymenobacter glaciei TaxID=877209 RepID=A0ABP7T4W7_9BACT